MKKLTEEEKEKLRNEMERKAKDMDYMKEECYKESMSSYKEKEDKHGRKEFDRSKFFYI